MSFTSERCPPALPGPPKRRFRLFPMGGELVGMVVAAGHRFHSSNRTHGISERPGFESCVRASGAAAGRRTDLTKKACGGISQNLHSHLDTHRSAIGEKKSIKRKLYSFR